MTYQVRTTKDAASNNPDDIVVPVDTVGEVCGDSSADRVDGTRWLAVDFGNVMCDLRVSDLEVTVADHV